MTPIIEMIRNEDVNSAQNIALADHLGQPKGLEN